MAQQESEHKLLTLDTVMYQRTYFVWFVCLWPRIFMFLL